MGLAPWDSTAEPEGRLPAVLDYKWELYKVSEDFSQATNLAAGEPAKLGIRLKARVDRPHPHV